jgi:TolB-like protein
VRSLAILPLKNLTGDPHKDFLGDGLTESLISQFSRYQDLKIISRTSAFAFKDKDATPQEVGKKLGVEGLLEGSVKQNGDKLRVEVRLVSAADGRVLWSGEPVERPAGNAFEIQDGVACIVGAELKVRLCGESELAKSATRNQEAYQAYLQGRARWHKRAPEDLKAALGLFERAVKADPNYALGYAGLADTYAVMEINNQVPPGAAAPKAREFAAKALALDDTLAGPYAAQGLLASNSDWKWQEGEKFYREALARNPGYATARQWYGYSLMAQGRLAEAEREMKRAQELDPLAFGVANTLNELYCHARQWDKCLEQAQISQKLSPGNWNALRLTGLAYYHKGMKAESVKALDEAKLTLSKEIFYNEDRDAARKQVEDYATSPEAAALPYFAALNYAAFGDKEATFHWLEKAYAIRQADMVMVHVAPEFDLIRDDPRYHDLLRRLGFRS